MVATLEVILYDTSMKNANLYNLVRCMIDPIAPFSNDRFVKLSKAKSIKVIKICDDITILIQTLRIAPGQWLLSLNTDQKTGSSTLVEYLHQLGHGISYTKTCYIEDK